MRQGGPLEHGRWAGAEDASTPTSRRRAELPAPARRGARARSRSTRSSSRSASASCRWSTPAPAARCSRASASIRRQIAAELGMVIPPVRIHDEIGARLARVRRQGPRGGGRPRPAAWPATSSRWTRATRSASSNGVPTTEPAFGLPAVWIADGEPRRGRGARLHGRRRRVGHRHAPDGDDPHPRRRPAHAPGDAPAARPAQGAQRSGRRGGRARRSFRSARSSACCRPCCARASRSATSARSSRRSATRRASPATRRCWRSTPARRSAARSARPHLDAEQHPAGDRARSRDRAGGGRVDHGHRRRRVPGDGAHARRRRS